MFLKTSTVLLQPDLLLYEITGSCGGGGGGRKFTTFRMSKIFLCHQRKIADNFFTDSQTTTGWSQGNVELQYSTQQCSLKFAQMK